MKLARVVGAFLVTLLLLCCPGATGQQNGGDSGVYHDFESFRNARMMLPQKHEPFCLVAAEGITLFNYTQKEFHDQNPLHGYRVAQSCLFDLNGDGMDEKFTLTDGRLTVATGSNMIWQTPPEWWVDYFFIGDANNDGSTELNFLVWKEGSFGPLKPFWLEEDDTDIKNHLFIFKLEDGNIKPVWQSSKLDRPNYLAALLDFNGDGDNELVALEGCYTDPEKLKMTVWKWNGWGFSRME